jgi:hypothetical protein
LDLASLLQSDVDTSTATLLIEMATAIVQQTCGGQQIIQVVDDTITLGGTTDSWLDLPQLPVTAVSAVVRDDGEPVTVGTGNNANYKLVGNRIWSRCGWQANLGWPANLGYPPGYLTNAGRVIRVGDSWQSPTLVTVTYTHGFAPGSQHLQLARAAVLALAKAGYSNPSGANSESIDDYSVSFDAMASRMEASPHLKAALAKKYGRRAGLARIG